VPREYSGSSVAGGNPTLLHASVPPHAVARLALPQQHALGDEAASRAAHLTRPFRVPAGTWMDHDVLPGVEHRAAAWHRRGPHGVPALVCDHGGSRRPRRPRRGEEQDGDEAQDGCHFARSECVEQLCEGSAVE